MPKAAVNQRCNHPDGTVAGWISASGCANPACRKAIREGRPYHATPAGFAVTLPDYHFETHAEARAALLAALRTAPPSTKRRTR